MGSLNGYSAAADKTIEMANHHFSLPLSYVTQHNIRATAECTCHIDNFVDSLELLEDPREKEKRQQWVLSFLQYRDAAAESNAYAFQFPEMILSLSNLRNVLDSLPEKAHVPSDVDMKDRTKSQNRKDAFLRNVNALFRYENELQETTSGRAFLKARTQEAKCYANLVLLVSNELLESRKVSGFFRRLSILGNIFDSLKDYAEDKANGSIRIPRYVIIPLALMTAVYLTRNTLSAPERNTISDWSGIVLKRNASRHPT